VNVAVIHSLVMILIQSTDCCDYCQY